MFDSKRYNLLSITKKAGLLVSGDYKCEEYIKKNRVKLLIISEDASDNTKKRFINMCKHYNTEYIIFGTKHLLAKAIGKDIRVVLGITDENLSHEFKNIK